MDSEQVKRMRAMIERMYWEHGYRVEEIVQRLRLSRESVEAVVSQDYVETSVWDEDNNTYRVERVQRKRAQERPRVTTTATTAKDKDNMIFPDRPKRYTASASISASISTKEHTEPAAETPLHSTDDRNRMIRQQLERIAQSATGIQTPLHRAQNTSLAHTDPAARLGEWLEFTALITVFAVWVAYWLGVHRGAW